VLPRLLFTGAEGWWTALRQILNIAYYEIIHIFRDKILLLMVFIVPLAYACVIGSVYVNGILSDIPMGIVDMDNSELSREVSTAFRNSPQFKVIREMKTYTKLEEAMKEGVVRAGVVIPENFEKKVVQHRGSEVLIVYDASNLIWAYNTRKYALQVVNSISVDRTSAYLAGLGMTRGEIRNTLEAVSYVFEVWYNPTFNYATFIFLGIVMMIIHQIGLYSVSLTVTREKNSNSWLQFLSTPVARWKIFFGKTLPYFVANFFNYTLLLWFSAEFINVKVQGSVFLIILLGLLYDTIITSLGFFISVHAANSLQVTRFVMLLSVPLFMISGYTWPKTHIPGFINALARLMPFTWMAEGFRMVAVKNLGLGYIYTTILVLSVMAVTSLVLALSFSKRRKISYQPRAVVNSDHLFPQKGYQFYNP